jgi:hypothetical protein
MHTRSALPVPGFDRIHRPPDVNEDQYWQKVVDDPGYHVARGSERATSVAAEYRHVGRLSSLLSTDQAAALEAAIAGEIELVFYRFWDSTTGHRLRRELTT